MNERPHILIIWGDDIGISNLSCYSDGLTGYGTPTRPAVCDDPTKRGSGDDAQVPNDSPSRG